MELDQLKTVWTAQQEQAEKSLRLNGVMLAQMNLGTARRSVTRLSGGLAVQIVALAAIVLFAGSFAADHWRELHFFVPAVMLWAYTLAMLIGDARQLFEIHGIDFDEPVVAIQLRIERLRVRRAWIVAWLLAFGPLMWLPASIVVARGLWNVDLYAYVTIGWIIANVLLGVAVIPVCVWIARAFGERLGTSRAMRAVIDAVAGNDIAAALRTLEVTRRFEQGI